MQANRGVYALLLGSGVSKAAGIPTGWEIVLDLLKKLAAIMGDSSDADLDRWYREKYGKAPDYSDILDQLAKTPTERQQLLRPYFEPNEQERDQGLKQPTAAHRAIANLVAQGFVKVIITTNFDRLIEKALEEVGVVPTVLSTPDQVKGAPPLIHISCCVLKVHGDYQDTRILNSLTELENYPPEFDQLLDRILDEFGLIVCGWSGEWDTALRNAISRAPSRRFTTYWAVRGEASDEAKRLMNHRDAQVVGINGADAFFQAIHQTVESIEGSLKPDPLSTETAVASLKRYLSEPRYRIQLSDLIDETIDRVIESISSRGFDMSHPRPDSESVTARVRAYEAACSTLLAMAPVAGRWVEEDHFVVWQQALERLATVPHTSGNVIWLGLQRYPATLLLYTLGLGALSSNKLQCLGRIFETTIPQQHDETKAVVQLLPPFSMFGSIDAQRAMQLLEGKERHHVPLNDWLYQLLRQYTSNTIPNSKRHELLFDKLEILVALSCAHHAKRTGQFYWAPLGSFLHRYSNRRRILEEIEESISTLQNESSFVEAGIFGDTAEGCLQSLKDFDSFVSRAAPQFGVFW